MLRVLNFGHPFTDDQLDQLRQDFDQFEVVDFSTHFDIQAELAPQIERLLLGRMTPQEWATTPILVNPPGLAPAAILVMVAIHGLAGYFPPIIRLTKADSPVGVTVFRIAEQIDLDLFRSHMRSLRHQ